MKRKQSTYEKFLGIGKNFDELSLQLYNNQNEIVLKEQIGELSSTEKAQLNEVLESDLTEYWKLTKINRPQITKMLYQTALQEFINA